MDSLLRVCHLPDCMPSEWGYKDTHLGLRSPVERTNEYVDLTCAMTKLYRHSVIEPQKKEVGMGIREDILLLIMLDPKEQQVLSKGPRIGDFSLANVPMDIISQGNTLSRERRHSEERISTSASHGLTWRRLQHPCWTRWQAYRSSSSGMRPRYWFLSLRTFCR